MTKIAAVQAANVLMDQQLHARNVAVAVVQQSGGVARLVKDKALQQDRAGQLLADLRLTTTRPDDSGSSAS